MPYNLDDYTAYYTQDHLNAEFANILNENIEGDNLTPEEAALFQLWKPQANGDFKLQAYRDLNNNVIKQRVNPIWHISMKLVIDLLRMEPDQDGHSLINTNVEAVKNIAFDSDDGKWQITAWRTKVTESINSPFEPTNAKPVQGIGNLLCDEIVFQQTDTDKKVVMLYAWNTW